MIESIEVATKVASLVEAVTGKRVDAVDDVTLRQIGPLTRELRCSYRSNKLWFSFAAELKAC